ncbi:hypothetical protein Tco_1263442 [Tanacetum coccineum]
MYLSFYHYSIVGFTHDNVHVQGDRKAEVFQGSNYDAVVAQRWLEDKQLEEKANTDCLVNEQEKVHLVLNGIRLVDDCDCGSLLDAVRIIAAHVFVNAAQLDLVLLVQNCSAEVNAASENVIEVTTASEYQVNAANLEDEDLTIYLDDRLCTMGSHREWCNLAKKTTTVEGVVTVMPITTAEEKA